MATLQELRKKLKGIHSTVKLTKAMKTVSSVKFSKLNRIYSENLQFFNSCESLYNAYSQEINSLFPNAQSTAPEAVFVMASNKGMCGGFNTEIFNFFQKEKENFPENTLFFPCGKKAVSFFGEKKIPYEKSFEFSDIPSKEESKAFLDEILSLRENGKFSSVYVIYPKFKNVMKQIPETVSLFSENNRTGEAKESITEFFPDKETVLENIADIIIFNKIHSFILQTALGSQAATLTTMRSASDTAAAYCAKLETEINRKRQSEVTADVIETTNKS